MLLGPEITLNCDPGLLLFLTIITVFIDISFAGSLNIVYRSKTSYNKINDQISDWINKKNGEKNFGINIHQLLRYLRVLGDNFNNLINNFSNILLDSPEYLFNNPLKFIVNKVWENNYKTNINLQKLC